MKKKLLIASLITLAIPLLLYLIGVIVFLIIFPANGYRSSTTAGTNSMYPVLIGKSLIIENKNIPFEDLKVGDIITYREPVDWIVMFSEPKKRQSKSGKKASQSQHQLTLQQHSTRMGRLNIEKKNSSSTESLK